MLTFIICSFDIVSAVDIVNLPRDNILVWVLSAALAISAIVIAGLIYSTKKHEKTSCGCCKGRNSHS